MKVNRDVLEGYKDTLLLALFSLPCLAEVLFKSLERISDQRNALLVRLALLLLLHFATFFTDRFRQRFAQHFSTEQQYQRSAQRYFLIKLLLGQLITIIFTETANQIIYEGYMVYLLNYVARNFYLTQNSSIENPKIIPSTIKVDSEGHAPQLSLPLNVLEYNHKDGHEQQPKEYFVQKSIVQGTIITLQMTPMTLSAVFIDIIISHAYFLLRALSISSDDTERYRYIFSLVMSLCVLSFLTLNTLYSIKNGNIQQQDMLVQNAIHQATIQFNRESGVINTIRPILPFLSNNPSSRKISIQFPPKNSNNSKRRLRSPRDKSPNHNTNNIYYKRNVQLSFNRNRILPFIQLRRVSWINQNFLNKLQILTQLKDKFEKNDIYFDSPVFNCRVQ